ncbi:MAG: T9SS type A sorting domain-containing protein, partial [bacterium]
GKNIIIVSVRKQAGNTGFATVIIEVADKKEIIPPGQKPTIALDDSTKIEILDNPFTNATATITINDNPDEANFALADQNLPKGVDISGLAEAVREFKLFERENANAGTTTGRFKITIPYPATIPDDKARDLKIYWLNTDANRWELAGGKSDMANHTVTVEVTHLSIFRAAFLSSPLPPKVIVYPNPYNARRDDRIYFKGTIELSLIRIFTLSGELVKEIKASNNTQDWDVKNASGCTLASGMYFYLITDTQGNKATGKIAVIR